MNTVKKLLKRAIEVDNWMLLHHAYWKHDLRPTNETIKNVIRNGELLEYHDEANTDRLLFSYEDYHYVLDLDDEKVVTVYKPLIRKRLSDRDNIRGIYSNGNLHNIKTDGRRRTVNEWNKSTDTTDRVRESNS
tara:strand:- start:467 stop:865 length:399 start_codon:yes stop_codon:yes gene_type:complete